MRLPSDQFSKKTPPHGLNQGGGGRDLAARRRYHAWFTTEGLPFEEGARNLILEGFQQI